jgi:hypothetical protein
VRCPVHREQVASALRHRLNSAIFTPRRSGRERT